MREGKVGKKRESQFRKSSKVDKTDQISPKKPLKKYSNSLNISFSFHLIARNNVFILFQVIADVLYNYNMNNVLAWLLFKLISFAVQSLLILQSLLNDFLRYIYIPIIMAGSSPKKIIRSLSALPKKPTDEVTMVVDARADKTTDIARTAINIMRYGRMIEEGISPKSLVCLVSTHNLTHQQLQKLQEILTELKYQESILRLQYEEQTFATQRLKVQKSKLTPLVISFCSYPSIVCLPPSLLIGAQISFNPPILKATDYDILSSFQRYSNSEQRKGK